MLRTSSELIRYAVAASDGEIGTVEDLLFEDTTWRVRSIVVDTGGFLSHHRVLVSPEKVVGLRFPEETFVLSLTKADVEASPGIESNPPVSLQHTGHDRPPGQKFDRHLRSTDEVSAYAVRAKDDETGQVHGLIIETATWTIRYIIVDTGEWLRGKLVLLSPEAIRGIDWSNQTVRTNVTADEIRHCPAYEEAGELSRDYEAFLHDYYGWMPYWP